MRHLVVLFIAFAALVQPLSARAADLPADKQALMLLRALTFDRALISRSRNGAVVVVAYKESHYASEQVRREIAAALDALSKSMTVAGKQVKAVAIPYTDAASFAAKVKAANAVAIYVSPGLSDAIRELSTIARAERLLTFCGAESCIEDGLSIGLLLDGRKMRLLVNLRAAKSEGADLDSSFLRVAEVMR